MLNMVRNEKNLVAILDLYHLLRGACPAYGGL